MLSTLSSLNADRVVEDKTQDLKQYGLDEPAETIVVTEKNGKEHKLLWVTARLRAATCTPCLPATKGLYDCRVQQDQHRQGAQRSERQAAGDDEPDKLSRVELAKERPGTSSLRASKTAGKS